MRHPSRAPDRELTFTSFYAAAYPDLVRFVQRRAHPDHVDDVVAEAFLVVWRRLDALPPSPDDARAWAFGIARHVLLNARRSEQRRSALRVRLAQVPPELPGDPAADGVATRVDLATAWHRLSETHQEALALVVFEDLDATRAGAVLGISPIAFRLRLSRARRALRGHLDHLPARTPAPADLTERATTP